MLVDENGKKWFKGNLHTHTTISDGKRTPEEVISLYRNRGYDFLALTDHWHMGRNVEEKDFLLLSGCEYDTGTEVRRGIYHIVGIGMEQEWEVTKETCPGPQQVIDRIHADGGIAILAHPAWSLNRAEEVMRLKGFDGCEIYNTTSGLPWNCRPYSGNFLDELATRGMLLPCMAADDTHHYSGDECRSFLMVQAEELSRPAILDAIRKGRFYASQGPHFRVEVEGGNVHVTSTPVDKIVFFTDWIWENDRATVGEGICEAYFSLHPPVSLVRVELEDREGNKAWSSFLQVGGKGYERL